MTYPKKLMSIDELHRECGYPKRYLYDLCRQEKAELFVIRRSVKGKILIDTEAFEQVRKESSINGK